jgi:seryl-tRNA synthetase
LTKQIATLINTKNTTGANKVKAQVKTIKEKVARLSTTQIKVEQQLNTIMRSIPNTPHTSVPVGKDEKANVEVRKWGEPNKFSFKHLPH